MLKETPYCLNSVPALLLFAKERKQPRRAAPHLHLKKYWTRFISFFRFELRRRDFSHDSLKQFSSHIFSMRPISSTGRDRGHGAIFINIERGDNVIIQLLRSGTYILHECFETTFPVFILAEINIRNGVGKVLLNQAPFASYNFPMNTLYVVSKTGLRITMTYTLALI